MTTDKDRIDQLKLLVKSRKRFLVDLISQFNVFGQNQRFDLLEYIVWFHFKEQGIRVFKSFLRQRMKFQYPRIRDMDRAKQIRRFFKVLPVLDFPQERLNDFFQRLRLFLFPFLRFLLRDSETSVKKNNG